MSSHYDVAAWRTVGMRTTSTYTRVLLRWKHGDPIPPDAWTSSSMNTPLILRIDNQVAS